MSWTSKLRGAVIDDLCQEHASNSDETRHALLSITDYQEKITKM